MKLKIALVIGSMRGAGGAERVYSHMIRYWVERGWELHLLTFDTADDTSFYSLPEGVSWHKLGKEGKGIFFSQFLSGLRPLRTKLQEVKPDMALSFMNVVNLSALLAMIGLGIPLIISDRNNPRFDGLRMIYRLLQKSLYPRADHLVVLTQKQIFCYSEQLKKMATAIPIPAMSVAEEKPDYTMTGNYILSVGRLRKQKGHDVLIRAFASVKDELPDWKLLILGEGVERSCLEHLIREHHLENRVFLPGIKKGVHSLMRGAGLFVFPSRWEGMGNAMVEAMVRGVPVIASDCDFGPGEVIQHGENGMLVPVEDFDQLADQIKACCLDKSLREKLGQNAKRLGERLDPSVIMKEWEALIEGVLKHRDRMS